MTSPEEAPTGSSAEAEYATVVEDAFIQERGTPFLLSPKDWQLIRGFFEKGVPVDTVIRAVRETFERRRARGDAGKVSSFAYCANAVEERWQMERRGLVGRGDAARNEPPEGVAPRLLRLSAALREAIAAPPPATADPKRIEAALSKAQAKLDGIDAAEGFDAVEDALKKIEIALAAALEKSLADEARAALEAEVLALLGDTGDLSASARERMHRALKRREIRRLFGVPALTLFDA